MKLLVLAQLPPPVHGQSLMVQTLVEGLPTRGISVHHVNLALSRDAADIGRWRLGKIIGTLVAATRAIATKLQHDCDTLYYVPAPGKRGALYRDLAIMLICRPFFPRLVLHWHSNGLGEWLVQRATPFERRLAQWCLGNADLSLVLDESLRHDATWLRSRRIAVVPNGVADPKPSSALPPIRANSTPCEILFLGLCTREKGLWATVEAVALANARQPGAFRLTVAGSFSSAEEESQFRQRVAQLPEHSVRHVGFATEEVKRTLFAAADVFCFPTFYPHEGQPLTLIEALAHDLPIVTTRWRAIPNMLPTEFVRFVEPDSPQGIADGLVSLRAGGRPNGANRNHYLTHFTPGIHLHSLREALLSLELRA